jgi:1-deoxy-D-xylulose-5-phosphate reductoisomerase
MKPLPIAILGSTGSIGQSTLKVVDRHPDRLSVVVLAGGSNAKLIVEQALKYRPKVVALADDSKRDDLRAKLEDIDCEILTGPGALGQAVVYPEVQTVVVGVVGFAGVEPTLKAIEAGKNVALANKETLVTAGSVVMARAQEKGVAITPIDSEHSAIYQCLGAGETREIRRLILTASGGPFRQKPLDAFASINPAEALAHPTWSMGPRITIDSATMMNKGFEVIEAAWLFGIDPSFINVVIHPQSIVHSMVEFQDGSVIAQMGPTDMTFPIAYALFAPERLEEDPGVSTLDFSQIGSLEFEVPDPARYPALDVARRAWQIGGTAPAVLNAADEVAVGAFLQERISFPEITALVSGALDAHSVAKAPSIGDIETADQWARAFVNEQLQNPSAAQRDETMHASESARQS